MRRAAGCGGGAGTLMCTWGLPDGGGEGAPASTDHGRGRAEMMGRFAAAPPSGESLRQASFDVPTAMPLQQHEAGGDSFGEAGGGAVVLPPVLAVLSPADTATADSALCSGANSQQEDGGDDTDSLEPVEDDSYYPSGARRCSPTGRARTSLHMPTGAAMGEALSACVRALQASGGGVVQHARRAARSGCGA